jgi:hypothetical protein
MIAGGRREAVLRTGIQEGAIGMAWLPEVPDDEMPEELADTVAAQRKFYGEVLHSTRMSAYVPHIALGAGAMSRGFSRSGRTPKQLANLLNLRVAAIVGCPL